MTRVIESIHNYFCMQCIPVDYLEPPSAVRQETPPPNPGESQEPRDQAYMLRVARSGVYVSPRNLTGNSAELLSQCLSNLDCKNLKPEFRVPKPHKIPREDNRPPSIGRPTKANKHHFWFPKMLNYTAWLLKRPSVAFDSSPEWLTIDSSSGWLTLWWSPTDSLIRIMIMIP